MSKFWKLIWNICESTNIGLGKYAPYVFGKMLKSKPIQVDYPSRTNKSV